MSYPVCRQVLSVSYIHVVTSLKIHNINFCFPDFPPTVQNLRSARSANHLSIRKDHIIVKVHVKHVH